MRNDYGSLVETWKVDLIVDRARRKGFRRDEIEDVQQEIIPAVLDFEYDSSKANGATEATALTALIDKQLTFLQRGRARRRRHEERYRELRGAVDGRSAPAPVQPDPERQAALAMDVRQAVAKLTPKEQAVCAALSRDQARSRIAEDLGVSRYQLDRIIDGIRERFEAMGLDAWMRER